MALDIDTCPLPEVAEALAPYIKPRQQVTAIRDDLHRYLETKLHTNGTSLHPVTLPLPPRAALDPPAPALSGVRKAYWKALQAHAEAQANYDALRAQLEQLKHRGMAPTALDSINEDYVPLLRQREKQRKFKAIEKYYLEACAAGETLSEGSMDEAIKRQIGDHPIPPNVSPASRSDREGDAMVLELKKALISTTRNVTERKKALASSQASSPQRFSPQAEIAGLQAALQELTVWMETQLTIISNAETQPPAESSPNNNGAPHKPLPHSTDIQRLYRRYLEARTRLTDAVTNPPESPPEHDIEDLLGPTTKRKDPKSPSKSLAEVVLPYLSPLIAGKQHESSLVERNAYTRRQLSAAEADTERVIKRLAGESHLVQPDARQGEDWALAAKEAEAATRDFIDSRVEAGEGSTRSAKGALQKIQELSASLDEMGKMV